MSHFDEISSAAQHRHEAFRQEAAQARRAGEARMGNGGGSQPKFRRRLGIMLLRWGNRLAGFSG